MGLRDMLKRWLDIMPAQDGAIVIQEVTGHAATAMRNRLLYRGDPSELEQYFHAAANDAVTRARFWAVSPSRGSSGIRKIHSGLPGMMVNTLADVVVTDMLNIDFEDGESARHRQVWQEIEDSNAFKDLVAKAVIDTLVSGDGAFKVSIDTTISDVPIIEFFGGERVEYVTARGRVQEVHFYTPYSTTGGAQRHRQYMLKERYGKGYIRYELLNGSGDRVDISLVPELADLKDVSYEGDYLLAVPFKVYPSPKWPDRGRSIYDLKLDAFDALDETISQWQDAIRLGRIKRYIPESMIPRDPQTGALMAINPLDNVYTAMRSVKSEDSEARIQTDQPVIQYDGYLGTYITNLDMCLQGIVSPSTLGIDTKKLDNAEAQREKEKTTLYTRNKIVSVLQDVMPKLIDVTLKANAHLHKESIGDVMATVEFGEYANPSFEAQIETVGKAASVAIMSIETQVETLWGDTKDDKWKKEEVTRLKAERGVMEVQEPTQAPHGFLDDLEGVDDGLDSVDNRPPNRDGALPIREHGQKSEQALESGNDGATQVDTVAGDPAKELKTV